MDHASATPHPDPARLDERALEEYDARELADAASEPATVLEVDHNRLVGVDAAESGQERSEPASATVVASSEGWSAAEGNQALARTSYEPPAPIEPIWKRFSTEVVSGVQTLLSAAVYATLIVTFVVQVARVDGMSMAPTLEDHDRLIVNKLAYGFGDPLPGDIVMLYYPVDPTKMFVKRIIAKEGDVVRIVEGRVYVNDLPLHDDYVPPEFRSHDDWGPSEIEQGYYFVLGDHRNNSSDSRHWGLVPKKYIVGKVKLRWWPLRDAKIF
jgi:signal peptidase I